MAVSTAVLGEVATDIKSLQQLCLTNQETNTWHDAYTQQIQQLQTLATDAVPDAVALAYLDANRAFITNSGGAPVDLDYNGQTFTFTNGKVYNPSKEEAAFFIAEADRLGYSVVQSTVAAYTPANGIVATYFQ